MILLTKPAQLILEATLGVVLPLAIDVLHQCAQVRGSDGEQSISTMPRKSGNALLLHPHGRRRLDLGHNLRRGARRGKPQGQMHMVLNTANSKAFAIELARRTRQIRMRAGPISSLIKGIRCLVLKTIWTRFKLSVCAMVPSMCRAYSPQLFLHHPYPGLRPGLLCQRAFGPCFHRPNRQKG